MRLKADTGCPTDKIKFMARVNDENDWQGPYYKEPTVPPGLCVLENGSPSERDQGKYLRAEPGDRDIKPDYWVAGVTGSTGEHHFDAVPAGDGYVNIRSHWGADKWFERNSGNNHIEAIRDGSTLDQCGDNCKFKVTTLNAPTPRMIKSRFILAFKIYLIW